MPNKQSINKSRGEKEGKWIEEELMVISCMHHRILAWLDLCLCNNETWPRAFDAASKALDSWNCILLVIGRRGIEWYEHDSGIFFVIICLCSFCLHMSQISSTETIIMHAPKQETPQRHRPLARHNPSNSNQIPPPNSPHTTIYLAIHSSSNTAATSTDSHTYLCSATSSHHSPHP